MHVSTSSIHLFIHISNGESRNAWKLHPQMLVIKNHHPACYCRSRVFWFRSRNMKRVYFYVHFFFFWRKESQLSSNYQRLCKPPQKVRNCCC